MTTLGAAHLAAAAAALAFGAVVFAEPKGTRTRRILGAAYVAAMIATNASALGITRLTGAFGPFHALALISLAVLARGVVAALRRRPGWLLTHYYSMAWSYVGLLAAACAEIAVRVPFEPLRAVRGGGTIGLISVATFIVLGYILLPRLQARALAYRRDDGA